MGICTGEDLTPGSTSKPVEREDRRQKGGSEMGEERAEEISHAFQRAMDTFEAYENGLFARTRIGGREIFNKFLEMIGAGRFVKPSSLFGSIPHFREREKDTLQDVRKVVLKALNKVRADVTANAGTGSILVADDAVNSPGEEVLIDELWKHVITEIEGSFGDIAGLMHLDRKHPSTLSRVKLEPGEEE